MLGKKVALDLGSAAARLFVKGEGTVFDEPALLALSRSDEPLGIGIAAMEIATQPGVRAVRPIRSGVIVDPASIDLYVVQLLARAVGRQRIFKPDAMISVASAMSGDDRRTMLDCMSRAGTRTAYLIDAPLAAAIGAGLNVASRDGVLIVDAGAGTTDIAVLALEGTVSGATLRKGGLDLDEAITMAIRQIHGVDVAPHVAEVIKRELAAAVPPHEERVLRVEASRDGAETYVNVSSNDVAVAVVPIVDAVVDAVHHVLEDTPRSVLLTLRQRAAVITGGGAHLRGLDRHLSAVSGMRFVMATDPEGATLRGCASALDNLDLLKRNFLFIR